MLEETFTSLVNRYQNNPQKARELWRDLVRNYTDTRRHYHTLDHLTYLLRQISTSKESIDDMDTMLFALYYHDAVYDVLRNDNEEKSAELAAKTMRTISVPAERIALCVQHIMATKGHAISTNPDTNLFTDADLSILGNDWDTYDRYRQNVRKEFSIYPDLLYRPGRKKILTAFLRRQRIFNTELFHQQFENQARINIQREISLL